MTKDGFREKFGDDPRKDDVTMLSALKDDPTDTVGPCSIYPPTRPLHPSSNSASVHIFTAL